MFYSHFSYGLSVRRVWGYFPETQPITTAPTCTEPLEKFMCTQCKNVFNRKDKLDRHLKKHDSDLSHHFPDCLKAFMSEDALNGHIQQHHEQQGGGAKGS